MSWTWVADRTTFLVLHTMMIRPRAFFFYQFLSLISKLWRVKTTENMRHIIPIEFHRLGGGEGWLWEPRETLKVVDRIKVLWKQEKENGKNQRKW